MRYLIMCLLLVIGCDKKEEQVAPPKVEVATTTTETAKPKVQLPLTGQKPLLKSAASGSTARGFKEPLPDGVVVDFAHNVIMETERVVAGVKVRTVMVEPKVPVADAITTLTTSFTAAGYKAGERAENTIGFSKGGQGEGMMAIASGGRHVALTFNTYKPDNVRVKDGYTGMINFAIKTPEK